MHLLARKIHPRCLTDREVARGETAVFGVGESTLADLERGFARTLEGGFLAHE